MTRHAAARRRPDPAEAPGGEPPAARGLVRRRRVLLAVVVGCLVCTGAGAGAATLIKSPAQAAAETVAPRPDVLTAPVVRKVLAQSVVTRGKVTASQRAEITAGGSAKDVGRSVVTKVKVKAGETVKAGQVMVEVSGRPIVLLQGAIPAYRDLMPGMTGQDVAQLQSALAAIGYSSGGDTSGVFGTGTEQAVARFYGAIGYESPKSEVAQTPPPRSTGDAGAGGKPAEGGEPATGAESTADATQGTVKAVSVMPLAEVAFVSSAPARADAVTAKVGDEATGTLLSLDSGSLVVNGSVASYEKGLLRPGQSVQILSEATGKQASGTVASIADSPTKAQDGEARQSSETYALRVKPSKALSADFNGADVRLTVVAASSQDKVLAVPTSAISSGADGLTSVTVRSGSQERRVAVRVGMTGDGYVQITPEKPARITEGEQVVVGVQSPLPAGQS
ncbi:peptidoglycan-binding protein [Streptomyces sp. NPDC048462]|uniref:peptidoglycan-binding protein n=1 Tax=Streptomyces sp. NPDC048462 TaxID=3365555 RepID=UPI00371F670C